MRYRAEIDGLRAVAVLPVIFFHAGFELFSGGFVGVDLFFVISGYLITSIIISELQQHQFSLIRFYERRARRILPALFVVMATTLPFAWFLLLPADMSSFSQSLIAVSTFLSNLFFWTERGYFGTASELKPLIHTWSLAIEEQYYFIFPLLLMGVAKIRAAVFAKLVLFILIFSSSLALCIWLSKVHPDSAFYLLPTRLWELMLGSFTAMFCIFAKDSLHRFARYRLFLEFLGLSCIVLALFMFDKNTVFPGYAALLPALGAVLIILFSSAQSPVGKVLSTKAMVGIGLISYSAYLWHQPVFAFARHFYEKPITPVCYLVLILLVLILSYCSWRYVEQPFRNSALWSRKGIFTLSAAGLVLFSSLGFLGWKTEGWMLRYKAADQQLLSSFVDASSYVPATFDRLQLADFPATTTKKKVLVIGDSYGKDLVNAITETELSERISLSTYQINSTCGNLYLDHSFIGQIAAKERARCEVKGWYDNARLVELIRQSDAIWLSSLWFDWVAALLPDSVRKLETDFGKTVVVFGRKSFGQIDEKALLKMSLEQRLAATNPLSEKHSRVQDSMRRSLGKHQFVDLSYLFCASDQYCRIFTPQGALISHDGSHLTKEGAFYMGLLLQQHPLIQQFLQQATTVPDNKAGT